MTVSGHGLGSFANPARNSEWPWGKLPRVEPFPFEIFPVGGESLRTLFCPSPHLPTTRECLLPSKHPHPLLEISPWLTCQYETNYMPHSGIKASLFTFPGLILAVLQGEMWTSPFVSRAEPVSGNLTPITIRFSIINIGNNLYCPVFTQIKAQHKRRR